MMSDKIVSVLRDTGCLTVVVRRGLVNDDQLTGKDEMCFRIDGTVRGGNPRNHGPNFILPQATTADP